MAAEYSVEQLPSPLSQLGEGPVWDVDTQSLYYVDINGAAILRYDYAENKTYSAKIGTYMSASTSVRILLIVSLFQMALTQYLQSFLFKESPVSTFWERATKLSSSIGMDDRREEL